MPSDAMITLIINARNLATAQLKALQKDLKGVDDAGARTNAMLQRGGMIAKGGLALGFGLAAKGAGELADTQAQLQADTGASAEAAHGMALAVNEIAGASRQSLGAVETIMAKIASGTGITGDALTAATKAVTDFSRVTGTDATESVNLLDGVADAWNLTAEQGIAVMDKLVVSHQRYGTEVGESGKAIVELGPQLRALNISMDDSIGFLNMMEVSGLDSSKAVAALKSAVQNLKPGQTFQSLLDQLAAIPDPTERARKAIEMFGAKSGIGMANLLRPGQDSLRQFAISDTDGLGAVTKAAAALDSTFPAMIAKAMSEAGASVRSFGDMFGPSLMAAMSAASLWQSVSGALGMSLTGALKGGWTAAVSSPSFLGAVEASGGSAGLAFAKGFITKGVPLIGIALAGKDTLGDGSPERQELLNRLNAAFSGAATGAAEQSAPVVQAALNDVGEAAGRYFAQGWATGSAPMVTETRTTMSRIVGVIRGAHGPVTSTWADLLKERHSKADAADQLIINSAERAAQRAIIANKNSTDAQKAQARIALRNLRDEKTQLEGVIKGLNEDASSMGASFTRKFAAGLVQDTDRVATNAAKLSRVVKQYLQVRSPSELGPFSEMGGPEGWGARFGSLYAKGLGTGLAATGSASAAFATSVVSSGAVARPAGAGAAAAGSGGAGGVHLHVHSAYPPTRAQISEWADQLDAEFASRQPVYSPYGG